MRPEYSYVHTGLGSITENRGVTAKTSCGCPTRPSMSIHFSTVAGRLVKRSCNKVNSRLGLTSHPSNLKGVKDGVPWYTSRLPCGLRLVKWYSGQLFLGVVFLDAMMLTTEIRRLADLRPIAK